MIKISDWSSWNIFLKLSVIIFGFGCGPLLFLALLSMVGLEVSDNPIGLGLLFFVSLPTSLFLLVVGIIRSTN